MNGNIDYSLYEEDFYSMIDRKPFKQISDNVFILSGKCKLNLISDKSSSVEVDLSEVYSEHPELFRPFENHKFDLSPIGLSNDVQLFVPTFTKGFNIRKFKQSANDNVSILFEILDTLGYEMSSFGDNMTYTYGRGDWYIDNLKDFKKKGLLVFRLLRYGSNCYVDVVLSKEEAEKRGIAKENLYDKHRRVMR